MTANGAASSCRSVTLAFAIRRVSNPRYHKLFERQVDLWACAHGRCAAKGWELLECPSI
jgi:hypothetical protein